MSVDNDLEILYKNYPMYRELFPKQLEFILNPNRFVCGLTGSRSGKTTGCAVYAAEDLSKNIGLGLYVARTDTSVREIFMPIIEPLLRKYKIRAKVTRESVNFSNGSKLLVLGANHIHKVENFRGMKFRFAMVDEAASFDQDILNYLVNEILRQRLSDLQGKMFLMSTPAAHCSGLFHKITSEKLPGWGVVEWSVFDNPHMKAQALADIELFMLQTGCDRQDARLLREYDGIWAKSDIETLVKSPTLMMPPSEFTKEKWRCIIGVDFGFNDKTVFSIIGWERDSNRAYVLKTLGFNGEDIKKFGIGMVSYIGKTLQELRGKYGPMRIVGDPAGASKIILDEMQQKYKICIEPALKSDKAHYIEIFNDALTNQLLVLHPTETKELQEEIKKLVWNDTHTREREGQPCDHFDATLYAWREVMAHVEKLPTKVVMDDKMKEKQFMEEVERQDAISQYGGNEEEDFVELRMYMGKQ